MLLQQREENEWLKEVDKFALTNAIYRTKEKYLELLKNVIKESEVLEKGYFMQLDKDEMSETSHCYIPLKTSY